MILDLFMQTGFKSFFSGILILMLAMAVMIIYMAFKNQKLNRELQELKSNKFLMLNQYSSRKP